MIASATNFGIIYVGIIIAIIIAIAVIINSNSDSAICRA